MKKFLTISIMVLFAQVASSDTLLMFKDGSANIWDNIYEKNGSYCTIRRGIELCSPKNEVVGIPKTVPDGTDTLEYGGRAKTNLIQSDRIGADEYAKLSEKRKRENAAEDAKRDSERAWNVKKFGEDRVHQQEVSGQSIPKKLER